MTGFEAELAHGMLGALVSLLGLSAFVIWRFAALLSRKKRLCSRMLLKRHAMTCL